MVILASGRRVVEIFNEQGGLRSQVPPQGNVKSGDQEGRPKLNGRNFVFK